MAVHEVIIETVVVDGVAYDRCRVDGVPSPAKWSSVYVALAHAAQWVDIKEELAAQTDAGRIPGGERAMGDLIELQGRQAPTSSPSPSGRGEPDAHPEPRAEVVGRIKAAVCGHHRVLVDQAQRQLVCRECGANVDALDWLLRLAMRGEALDTQHEQLRRQIAAATRERDAIRRQITRAKAAAGGAP